MLHGIRRTEMLALAADGVTVRVYLPFGTDWYGYYVRRLAERPANLLFLLRNLRENRGRDWKGGIPDGRRNEGPRPAERAGAGVRPRGSPKRVRLEGRG